jgi:hypothetical protein
VEEEVCRGVLKILPRSMVGTLMINADILYGTCRINKESNVYAVNNHWSSVYSVNMLLLSKIIAAEEKPPGYSSRASLGFKQELAVRMTIRFKPGSIQAD